MVEPSHLTKYAQVKLGSSSPQIWVKIKRYLKQPPRHVLKDCLYSCMCFRLRCFFKSSFLDTFYFFFKKKTSKTNIDTKWNTTHSFLVLFFIFLISQLPYAKKKHRKNQLANAIGGRFLTATHEFATASSSCSAWRLGTFFRMAGGFRKIGETEPILGIAF